MKRYIISAILLLTFISNIQAAPNYAEAKVDRCYKQRDIIYPLDDVFNALKEVLMQSNLNIVTVTKQDGVLTAKGDIDNKDQDTITSITMTINFRSIDANTTNVKAIASYKTSEKKSEVGQLGGAGVSLPIPVPLTGRYALVSSGNIEDSTWYQGFFMSLNKILFANKMKYDK